MQKAWLLLGGNEGEMDIILKDAIRKIIDRCGKLIGYSSVYETAPWGFESNNPFLNQLVVIHTELDPHSLLDVLLDIEKEEGRIRKGEGYSDRTLDIDILFIDDQIINSDNLIVPHPRIQERRFALIPLWEYDKDFIHPVLKKSNAELKKECPDTSTIAFHTDRILLSY